MTKTEKSASDKLFAERDLVINGTKFRVQSVFNEKVELESAIKNVVVRKMSEHEKAS
ncbi:MAG: hypothetical protein FWC32_01530 [Firmicutes bacterium]|nr:hypothetical protein [Bacillota bacterium]